MSTLTNPLLAPAGPPRFDEIEPSHVVDGVREILAGVEAEYARLESEAAPTWEGVVEPLERIHDALDYRWGIVSHLLGVRNSDELRAAFEQVEPEVVRLSVKIGQSKAIHDALVGLRDGEAWAALDESARHLVESAIRNATLSGVALEGEARERFEAIQLELAELGTKFSNQLLDATKSFELVLTEPDEVAGLPVSALELAAQSAAEHGHEGATAEAGPWRVTLDMPSYLPFMKHGSRRDLREKLYRATITRASGGELDNSPLIDRILALRAELAGLLGYASYAEVSLASKMAPGVADVDRLLEELRGVCHDAAQRDWNDLGEFASSKGEAEDLRQWDAAFWSESLRQERFQFSDEDLRPYFQLPRVLEGLFALTERLFAVRVVEAGDELSVWHPDVLTFRVLDDAGAQIASFALDPYSRPAEKRGGAWMHGLRGRSVQLAAEGEAARNPLAVLVCNGTPPVGDRPSLMTFGEVETLFHEFGHGLHHMLTRVDNSMTAGTENVEWDAVELPSQFMENWCYHRETLMGMTAHVETGERLPDELFDKVVAAKNYQIGSWRLRQLNLGLTDLELHRGAPAAEGETPHDVHRRISEDTAVLQPLPEDRFLCGFGHIFAGGYAAGYYSYHWAEVLSADAFAAFEEVGLDDERAVEETGRRYRETVLALGGSRPAMDVFRAFRGREPQTAALLRHSGFAE
ncbi:MAG: M3 family metallopeptidase [Planctomycetota bacterium]|jgi:oligopeptidase A|nr:M3 family metallopeptidase [Planctomycetota bacterium]MDP6990676.1 M3 family metallopeptidase [Planctomycetota bacterium]